jgi:hypothetical protein
LRGRDVGGDLTNVQYKPIWDYHSESPVQQIYPNKKTYKKKRIPNLFIHFWAMFIAFLVELLESFAILSLKY